MSVDVDPLFGAILGVEERWRLDDLSRDDVVTLWLDLTHAADVLRDVIKLVADDASGRLLDRDDPRAVYETPQGETVHLAPGYAPERWRGREVVQRLGQPGRIIDSHGAMTDETVVPVWVLLDVLPGCGEYDQTSSKWRTTGLRRHLPDWRRYRSRDDAPLVIRRGEPHR